ncbi:class I mannose-6-phosphate isomerase [Erythrobacter sp. F6033]|uniref:class I mannose-6-phosphate isomerase n=1 Tax=Erythrobacter sp. F6033 TaxID=2926401 RepID=UPI001FF234F5|nr:class I mannose-6-phosphate isomerase [Erythrobacter sp. F6033]MCK0129353.1 class I mannose-6-phosphate isomerase [Erythrobacter sp. F6033]
MTGEGASRQLPTKMVAKVWGRDTLPAPFSSPADERIGEIWFEPPTELPQLLVKYLFTSEKLSVQVHPGNHNAQAGEAGKEECWFVLDAEPGAKLAIGFDQELTPAQIEAAARDGSIEELLTWHDVKAGDVFYLPAGTVHAIGPGLALVEVQQNSDTTFRLYDYGRPRELHLERAISVADTGRYSDEHRGSAAARGQTLVNGAHFRLDRVEGAPDEATRRAYQSGLMALPLQGSVSAIDGEASAGAGECLYAASIDALDFSAAEVTLLTRPAA